MTDALLTWLCSYLLHSSLLIAGLWAAERAGWLARLATSTQETLWRLALLGGLLSASLPLLPAMPSLAELAPADVARAERVVAQDPARVANDVLPVAAPPAGATVPTAQLGALPITTRFAPQTHDLAVGFVAAWLLGAVLMAAVLAGQWAWLRRTVRRLPAVADPRWQARVAQLAVDM
ncbi:MAG TPA: hypothetical protein VGE36_11890, partial [Roseateles sp.]